VNTVLLGDVTNQRSQLVPRLSANVGQHAQKFSVSSMGESLAWALNQAREQTLALVADLPLGAMQLQAAPEERHPAWILGHLLLADSYLVYLLASQPLADDFPVLLERYGPASAPNANTEYHSKDQLVDRLRQANVARVTRVSAMTDHELATPMSDALLAPVQPTIGHHLQSLVFHEGYHAGQLSSWRKTHALAAVRWTMGPPRAGG
jgi:uncharacterized damage-inducible protein DinB